MAADGAVELHPWPSRIVDLHRPTWAILGVEPGSGTSSEGSSFDHVVEVTRHVRTWVRSLARAVAGTLPDLVETAASDGGRDGADSAGKVRLDHTANAAD